MSKQSTYVLTTPSQVYKVKYRILLWLSKMVLLQRNLLYKLIKVDYTYRYIWVSGARTGQPDRPPGLALTFLIMIIFFSINLHFIGAIFWRAGLVKIHSYAPESNLIQTT